MHKESSNPLAHASNALGFDLLRTIFAAAPATNILISPASVGISLALLLQGAGATTAQEIHRVCHTTGVSTPEIAAAARRLRASLLIQRPERLRSTGKSMKGFRRDHARQSTLSHAELHQSLWARKNLPLLQPFFEAATGDFAAELRSCDFSSHSAAAEINAWVSEKTHGKITQIDLPIPDELLTLILINVICRRDSWPDPFDKHDSRNLPFHGASRTTQPVFMSNTINMAHARAHGATYVALRCEYLPFAFDILLPDASITDFVANLQPKTFESLIHGARDTRVDLKLPRFKLESSFQLAPLLEQLGLRSIFLPASLPGIHHEATLCSISQNTCISIDEDGLEAAAATTSAVAGAIMPRPVAVTFDRPFLFAIRHEPTDAILFLGAVCNLPDACCH